MTPLFDSHAHLSFLEDEVSSVLDRAQTAHVTRIMNVAVDQASFEKGLFFQKEFPHIELFLAAATTPHDVRSFQDPFFLQVQQAAKQKQIKAIGECGLEYFHSPETKHSQQEIFRRYAELAIEENLPLIVHCREAFTDFLHLLNEFPTTLRGVLHCFTGTYKEAKILLDRGWYISFSGIITYPKSIALQEVLQKIPLNQILVETDSPYLAPQNHRGKKNEPSFLPEIVAKIASLKQISFDEVATTTYQNASQLFGV
jgi:TatD DNase family protein